MPSGSQSPRSLEFGPANGFQLGPLCAGLGSTATAVRQHAACAYDRDLFGQVALVHFTLPPRPPSEPTVAATADPLDNAQDAS